MECFQKCIVSCGSGVSISLSVTPSLSLSVILSISHTRYMYFLFVLNVYFHRLLYLFHFFSVSNFKFILLYNTEQREKRFSLVRNFHMYLGAIIVVPHSHSFRFGRRATITSRLPATEVMRGKKGDCSICNKMNASERAQIESRPKKKRCFKLDKAQSTSKIAALYILHT